MSDKCAKCGCSIQWRRNDVTGRPAPIQASPSDNGNIWLLDSGMYSVLNKDEADAARNSGIKLHLNHFAECPSAKHFKKKP